MVPAVNVVVLAAGEGKRLGGAVPKVLTPLWGRPAVCWPVDAALALGPAGVVVVGGADPAPLEKALGERPVRLARQPEPQGTGHAVLCAEPELGADPGTVLILNGDGPLVHRDLLAALLEHHRRTGAEVSFLSVRLPEPGSYGRVVRAADGSVEAIVEARDADPAVLARDEINAGLWVVEGGAALQRLRRAGTDNAQGEVYLTDLVRLTRGDGGRVEALLWDDVEDALGFNDQADLAQVRELLRRRLLAGHLARGVEIVDPATTYIDADVQIESGARILPCTMIEGRVSIASGCEVGPFTHLRDGTVLLAGAEVGNFTETKKTTLGPGSKAKHLTYLGDAVIGAGTNIGAGTITANYDGVHKHRTDIGNKAFIGSGTVIVAPSQVADGATTGAGAIVTRNSRVGTSEVWVGVPARPLGAARGKASEGTEEARP